MTLRDGVYWLDGAPVDAVYLGDEEVYRAFLVDNFDVKDPAKWVHSSELVRQNTGAAVIADGTLRYLPDPDPVNGGLDCYIRNQIILNHSIAETMVTVELVTPPGGTPPYCDAFLYIESTGDAPYWISMDFEMTADFPGGSLSFWGNLGSGSGGAALKRMAYDHAMMRWMRVRFTGGVVYSEYGSDGIDWTLFHSVAWMGESWPEYRILIDSYADPGVSEYAFDNFSWVAL